MGRLIEVDELITKIEEIYDGYMLSEDGGVVPQDFVEFLEEAPTVEAIPKDEYKNRLKADMVAMLTDLQLEIEELGTPPAYQDEDYFLIGTNKCSELIQQKINALKSESEVKE